MPDLDLKEKNRILMVPAIAILKSRKAKLELDIIQAAKPQATNVGWDRGDLNPDIESNHSVVAVYQDNLTRITGILSKIEISRRNGANYNICGLCGVGRTSSGVSTIFTPAMIIKSQEENGKPMDNFPCNECPKVKKH